MKRIASLILIAAFMCSMLLLASCNNNSPSNSPSASTDADTVEDDVPGDEREPLPVVGGTLVCGVTLYEPMNFRDDDGNWTGFDTEFATLVAEKLGMEVEFQEIEWSSKFMELNSGAITAIWNGFTANTEEGDTGIQRIDLCDMTYSYMLNQQCVVVRVDNLDDFADVEDLIGLTVAAESGSAGETEAKDLVGDSGTVIGTSAQINTFLEVKSGASDCAIVDILLAQRITGSGDYADLAIAPITLSHEVYAIGLKDDSELTPLINQAMLELFEDGILMELAMKYGLEDSLFIDINYGG
ncbi:MAG: transporter substrate-binding domain-containing protein [Oscillospiraceae bacterium]|nr:transporter substrate-binding domain-containing protein [Oscillospiraceae bacterium]